MTQIQEINDGIKKALANVKKNKAKGYNLQEPDYTAALAIEFPQMMNAKLCFPNIKFGGCFIHQSPKAKFRSPHKKKSCEVGDILVILRKRTTDDTRYNAALLQLKKSDTCPFSLKADEMKQLFLYEKWPKFKLLPPPASNPKNAPYDIYPKAVTQGALYGVVRENPTLQFYIVEPMQQMTFDVQMTFARFIRDAINWQTGRSISDIDDKNLDAWSKLIWDLLLHSAVKVFNRRKNNYKNHSRLSDDFFSLLLEEQGIDVSVPTNDVNQGKDDDYGISILFIDIDGCEGEQENQKE